MITPRCWFCWGLFLAIAAGLFAVALWLLTNNHETAGGWTLAVALLWVCASSCKKSCFTPDEMERWSAIEEREAEAEARRDAERDRA